MALTFLTFEEYKASLLHMGVPKQAATLTAGSMGGVTAVISTYPLDLVRATMATPAGAHHHSMGGALAAIAKERGPAALYAGVTATCIGVAPYAGLKFLAYEGIKSAVGRTVGLTEDQLKPSQRLGSGLVAGMLAQTCMHAAAPPTIPAGSGSALRPCSPSPSLPTYLPTYLPRL